MVFSYWQNVFHTLYINHFWDNWEPLCVEKLLLWPSSPPFSRSDSMALRYPPVIYFFSFEVWEKIVWVQIVVLNFRFLFYSTCGCSIFWFWLHYCPTNIWHFFISMIASKYAPSVLRCRITCSTQNKSDWYLRAGKYSGQRWHANLWRVTACNIYTSFLSAMLRNSGSEKLRIEYVQKSSPLLALLKTLSLHI